jgi:hypothetical protein
MGRLVATFFVFGTLDAYMTSYNLFHINPRIVAASARFVEQCVNTNLRLPENWETL